MNRYEVSMNLISTSVTVEADSEAEAIADAQELLEQIQAEDRCECNLTVVELGTVAEVPA